MLTTSIRPKCDIYSRIQRKEMSGSIIRGRGCWIKQPTGFETKF